MKKTQKNELPNWGITIWSNPDTSKIVGMNSIFYKLSSAIFMDIYSTCLTMMDFTPHDSWVGPSFHLKTSNTVVMDIVTLKESL